MEFGEGFEEKISNLQLNNIGKANLRISSMSITIGASAKKGAPGFFVNKSIPSDQEIGLDASAVAEIGCRNDPAFPLGLMGELEILSNDVTEYGKNQRLKVDLVCGPERTNIPIAKLICPTQVPILTWPALDGSTSTDVDKVTTTGLPPQLRSRNACGLTRNRFGLFPFRSPQQDLRETELNQLHKYA